LLAQPVRSNARGNHNTSWVSQYPFASKFDEAGRELDGWGRGNVVIGNDVWIAADASIMSGVNIGDGAVVAARSVVTKNVRPYSIVAGNPAREKVRRFDDNAVDQLLAMRWWEWPEHEIRTRWRELSKPPQESV
jgi:chloramphenicol O-acetyltransferase type B